MAEFGARLKEAREQRGVSLREIASVTKISVAALEALERNDLSRLPGGIFGRAFVRAYALEVGLDPDETLEQFLAEYERQHQAAAVKALPEVTADDRAFLERQRRAARWLRVIVIVLLLGVTTLVVNWRLSSRARTSAASDSVTTAGAPAVTSPEPAPAHPASTLPAASMPTQPPASVPPPVTPAADVPPPPASAAPTSAAADATQLVVRLQASADCWVRAAVDGTVVFQQILNAGESRELQPGQDVSLQVGNAGVIRWSINGRPARELGRVGQTASIRVTRATMDKYLQ